MLPRIATATIAAAAALTIGATGSAQADRAAFSQADTAEMRQAIQAQMTGKAFGWQFAIAQNGNLAQTSAGLPAGTAVSATDTGGSAIPMAPHKRMQIMSATKTFTAISTMKLLRANGLSIETSVAPYLPTDWVRGPGFKLSGEDAIERVRFRHLLNHTSGLGQMIKAKPEGSLPGNGWTGTKWVVATGTTPSDAYFQAKDSYKNINYSLLQVLNAELWRRSGGQMTQTVTEEIEDTNWKGDIITKHVTKVVDVPVDATSAEQYALDHMRKRIFQPSGVYGVSCSPDNFATDVRGYPPGATQATMGSFILPAKGECASHANLRLSSIEMLAVLAHLRHGTLVHPDDRALMDKHMLGWSATASGAYAHGGGVSTPGNWAQVQTCNHTFPDGTEATMIVNSQVGDGLTSPCRILWNAWSAARDSNP